MHEHEGGEEPAHLGWRNQSPGAILGELAKPVVPREPEEGTSGG